jgi:pyruvate ferredoxin oxidoreductase beta subunit
MNTGVQRSGTTPQWAITANTPIKGKLQPNKNVPAIMAAHGIDYVASTSAAYPLDLYDKVKKALTYQGVKYIHIHTPCPPGWGFDPRYAVKVGKLAVETGLYELYEIEKSQLRHTGASLKLMEKRRLLPVKDYLRAQGRFKTMADAEMEKIQDLVARKWEGYFESFDEIEGEE